MEEFKHVTPVQLRFSDFDMLGHVNNSVYLQLMDYAKTAYFKEVTGKEPGQSGKCPVVAHLELDFDAPITYPDNPAVGTRVAAIGTKSITLEQCVFVPETDMVKCRARIVMVNFDLKTGATAEIDPADREKISRFEGCDL